MSAPRVVAVVPSRTVGPLAPLLQTWRDEGSLHLVETRRGLPGPGELADLAGQADALFVVGPSSRAPRTVLSGLTVRARDGRDVPAAWLPDGGQDALHRFAVTSAAVHARAISARRTIAVLGQRHGRFVELADRLVALVGQLHRGQLGACRWTAYDTHREELGRQLALGPALAVYLGRDHALRPADTDAGQPRRRARPGGALLSLTCATASRRRAGLSLAEAVPLQGIAAAAIGAIGPTLPADDARWAVRIARSLPSAGTIGELVAGIATDGASAADYRLLGDPTVPLLDAPELADQLARDLLADALDEPGRSTRRTTDSGAAAS